MKLINQKAELLTQPKGFNGLEKQIEIAGIAFSVFKDAGIVKSITEQLGEA